MIEFRINDEPVSSREVWHLILWKLFFWLHDRGYRRLRDAVSFFFSAQQWDELEHLIARAKRISEMEER